MRHKVKGKKLGRTTPHRESMLASMVCHLIERKRIITTLAKAKEARSLAERMVTIGKKAIADENRSLALRRLAISRLRRKERVAQLFDEVAPAFVDRAGGYTRIVKLGRRRSDSSEMAVLEWVDTAAPASKTETTPEATEEKKPRAAKKPAKAKKDESAKDDGAEKKKPARRKKKDSDKDS